MNTKNNYKDKRHFHKSLSKKIFDITTFLNHKQSEFRNEFLEGVVITEYTEWLFGEHNVILRYKTVAGEQIFEIDNHAFDQWLGKIQPKKPKIYIDT